MIEPWIILIAAILFILGPVGITLLTLWWVNITKPIPKKRGRQLLDDLPQRHVLPRYGTPEEPSRPNRRGFIDLTNVIHEKEAPMAIHRKPTKKKVKKKASNE